jgi:hypothetical protein
MNSLEERTPCYSKLSMHDNTKRPIRLESTKHSVTTRFVFPLRDVEEFENKYSALLPVDRSQLEETDEGPAVRLSFKQLSSVVGNMIGTGGIEEFIRTGAEKFSPLSMSLFVFNDALWKMMKKKTESHDTMLPMATIPRFHWSREFISPGNPHGVQKDGIHRASLFFVPNQELVIQGIGGDFSGILEGQLVDTTPNSRPIFSPTLPPIMPNRVRRMPKYELCDIVVTIGTNRLDKELYPSPRSDIDYTFSEHPKVYLEHGLAIETAGSNVSLRVGNRKPQGLFGNVLILLGKRWSPMTEGYKIVEFHVWLTALFNNLW